MTLMPETYEPPPQGGGATRKFQPAMEEAQANPGRWVLVTELGTDNSAASRASSARKDLSRLGFELARDGRKILIRWPLADGGPVGADDAPHWPEAEEPQLPTPAEIAAEVPRNAGPGLPS